MQEEIKLRIDSFFMHYANDANASLIRNATVKVDPTERNSETVKCSFGIFYSNRNWEEGISYKTYEANKDYIEQKVIEAEQAHKEAVLKENWVVCALTNTIPYKAFKDKAIPLSIYRKMNAHYVTREMREEFDEFDGPAGWEYDEKIFAEEARKVATEEQLVIAEKINAQRKLIDERIKVEEKAREEEKIATLEEAKEFAMKYDLKADWSWDDYRFLVGEVVEEGKFWRVHSYDLLQGEVGNKTRTRVGYVLKQKNVAKVGIIGFENYSGKSAFEQVEANPPPAVRAFKEMIGA